MGACVHHTYGCPRASPWSASSSSSSTGASALRPRSQPWGILAFCRPSTGQTSDQEAWGRSNGWARGHVRRHSARGHTTHAAGDGDATIGRSRARGAHEVERKRRRISRTDQPGQVKLARGRKSRQTNRRVHVRVLVCIYASKLKVVSLKVVSFRNSGRAGAVISVAAVPLARPCRRRRRSRRARAPADFAELRAIRRSTERPLPRTREVNNGAPRFRALERVHAFYLHG